MVAGTEQAVLMVESEAHELSEEVMLGAVVYGHEQMQAAIRAINELADEGGKDDWDWEAAREGHGAGRQDPRARRERPERGLSR